MKVETYCCLAARSLWVQAVGSGLSGLAAQFSDERRGLYTCYAIYKNTTRTHFADRAFRCCAPSVWNSLDSETLLCSSLSGFKRRLKTLLFRQAFSSTTWTVHQRLWSHPTCWRYTNKIIIIIIITNRRLYLFLLMKGFKNRSDVAVMSMLWSKDRVVL